MGVNPYLWSERPYPQQGRVGWARQLVLGVHRAVMLKFPSVMPENKSITDHSQSGREEGAAGSASRWRGFCNRPSMWISTLLVSFIALCWPFLSSWEDWSPLALYIYIFSTWGLVILMIAIIGLSLDGGGSTPERTAKD